MTTISRYNKQKEWGYPPFIPKHYYANKIITILLGGII